MAGTILVSAALRRASILLNDMEPAQFQRHSQVDCVNALNDGALAIVTYLPLAGARRDAVKLRPGAVQSIESIAAADCKPGNGSTPSTPILGIGSPRVIRNMGADGLTPGRAVRVIDQELLDAFDRDWQLADRAKTAVSGFMHDPGMPMYFLVQPPVHASTAVWVDMAYHAQPLKVPNVGSEDYTAASVSTAKIPVPDEYIDDLVNYVVARQNMIDNEWSDSNKAAYFGGLFMNSLNAKVSALMGSNPNLKRLPFAPELIGSAS